MVYYSTVNGADVVEDEIGSFGAKDLARILWTVNLLEEFGTSIGNDYIAHIEGKIWELRASRHRVLYFTFSNKQFVLLRAFIKKTRKTPKKEINIAKHRMDDFLQRHS